MAAVGRRHCGRRRRRVLGDDLGDNVAGVLQGASAAVGATSSASTHLAYSIPRNIAVPTAAPP